MMNDHAEVARLTAARIREYPGTYDQRRWLMVPPDLDSTLDDSDMTWSRVIAASGTDPSVWAECGTTACVAGHAVAVGVELGLVDLADVHSICGAAGALLGIGDRESDTLFCVDLSGGSVLAILDRLAES